MKGGSQFAIRRNKGGRGTRTPEMLYPSLQTASDVTTFVNDELADEELVQGRLPSSADWVVLWHSVSNE